MQQTTVTSTSITILNKQTNKQTINKANKTNAHDRIHYDGTLAPSNHLNFILINSFGFMHFFVTKSLSIYVLLSFTHITYTHTSAHFNSLFFMIFYTQ